ncbi:MAG: YraN family protein [Paludibacteraceae bacterium]|nr:YraN family protein [Paludibacteraceae bacterium]
MTFVTNPIGIIGESEAARMLEKKGFKVVEHNWRMGHLEVDLIAESRKEIVFAEVKARTTTFGDINPEEYVDENKKRRMIAAANAYIKHRKLEKKPRFDIIGIVVNPLTNEITYRSHLEDAFQPYLRTIGTTSHSGGWTWGHRNKTIGKR